MPPGAALITECVLLSQNVFSYIPNATGCCTAPASENSKECVLLLQNVFSSIPNATGCCTAPASENSNLRLTCVYV